MTFIVNDEYAYQKLTPLPGKWSSLAEQKNESSKPCNTEARRKRRRIEME